MNETKVGVFLSDCGNQLSQILDFDALVNHVKQVPGVALVVKASEFWRGEGLKTIVDAIKGKKISRVVVAESLPKLSEIRVVKAA
ncbi:MAG: hypothetical protein OEZ40_06645, partial [Candidatus Bathyarchaeota archaeon]|nr:hypothetical protein [Candidatus Bathyarchaeota archaeon]